MKALDDRNIVYLDNAATSWPKPDGVANAMSSLLERGCANPGRSAHRMSVDTARMIYSVRDGIAELLGAEDAERIAFFYNATAALNSAIYGLLRPGDHVITSSMEHNSVMRPLRALEARGVSLSVVQCSADGSIDTGDIEQAIQKNTKAIIITHCSNVTGTIMPVVEIARLAHAHNIIFIVDGAQSAGAIPVNVKETEIDIFAFTGHKSLLGPQGTGGLYVREGIDEKLSPVIQGGTGSLSEREKQPDFMPDKFEAGTPNSPGIAGLGEGITFLKDTGIDAIAAHEKTLTRKFIDGLSQIANVRLYGPLEAEKRISVVSLNIGELPSSEVSRILDDDFGIMTRPGLHCAPAAHRTIGTIHRGTVRFSFSYFNTEDHIDCALRAIDIIARGAK